jgi:putative flavoprotein involved in K+ transport
MTTRKVDTLVIGAGQAGLNISRALQLADIDHVVFERGRIGESWLSQRWDSFRLNTPSWANGLLGFDYSGDDPDGFMDVSELVDLMHAFVAHFELPVRESTEVVEVRRHGDTFEIDASDGTTWSAHNVVVCSGAQNVPRLPAIAADITGVEQLHAADYRNPAQLPAGGVLVVGSAQTGGQIAEELADSGRDTYLCTGSVGSVPRRHRGRDIAEWMVEIGAPHTPVTSLEDPAARYAAQPMMSGVNGGHSMTVHSLARRGITVLGRLSAADGTHLAIGDDLRAHADESSSSLAEVRNKIDEYISGAAIDAPPAAPDDALELFEGLDEMAAIRELDLAEKRISTIIWATGFTGDFSYLNLEFTPDEQGVPTHTDGASTVEGLYFCGFPWLRIQASGLIYGSGIDAKVIADHIYAANSVRSWPAEETHDVSGCETARFGPPVRQAASPRQ